ncbi:thermonuclease family protein [Sphingomonas bacterium]|uniref:thermonuclease family protein n=1 Tax=Sphingomonas bacterium TaxID=1895847 RepID=UPI001576825C|nr:thermonuclease family protein [Sphingomonas bacterium]
MRLILILALAASGAAALAPSKAAAGSGRPYDGQPFSCPVIRVHDGDTFTCASGVRIRLQAIDAPEIGQCRGHGGRCVSGDGYASRDALRRLALGRTALCRPSGRSYDRIVALCSVGAVDLSCAQMRSGQAVERYDHLRCR